MTEQHLSDLLARAADDADVPLRADTGRLLDRARLARRRDRTRSGALAVVGVAVAVTVGVVAVPALVGAGPSTGPSGPHPTPHSTAPSTAQSATQSPVLSTGLSAAEVVDRCRPQLAAYGRTSGDDDPATSSRWQLVRPGRSYQPGQLALLTDGPLTSGNLSGAVGQRPRSPIFCLVPEAGDEKVPPPSAYHPTAAQPALLVDYCAEVAGTPLLLSGAFTNEEQAQVDQGEWPPSLVAHAPDLTSATVTTAVSGPVGTLAVLRGAADSWTCSVPSVAGGLGVDLAQTANGQLAFEASATGPKGAPNGAIWSAAALVPAGADRVVLASKATGETQTYPVRDGAVAIIFITHGGPGIVRGDVTWQLLDRAGAVLTSGDALDL